MKKGIVIPVVIVSILAILGGTFAGLWFFTDVFNFLKPANDVFSNQIEKAFNLEDAKFSDYSDFLKEYKDVSNKPVKSKVNMTAKLNISELDSDVQNIINKSKITLDSSSDIQNKKSQNIIELSSNNSKVLSLDLVTNNDKIGIGSKDLYDKYLTVSMEELIKVLAEESDLSSSDIETLTNSFSSTSNINPYDLLYISEDDLKHFDETYRNCITDLISKDCFTSKKKVEVEVDGEDVSTTAYYLTLTGEDTYKFIEDFTNLLKNDDVLAKIITEKVNMILATSDEKISEEDVKSLFNELSSTLTSELEEIKNEKDSAIQIAVYSNKTNPVRIEFNTISDVEEIDEKETLISMEITKNKKIYNVYENDKAIITVINEFEKNSDEEKIGSFEIKASGMSVGTLKYEFIDKKDESKLKLTLNIPVAKLNAEIDFSSNGDYTKEAVKFNGKIAFSYDSESIEINMDGSTEYGNVSIPDLNSNNSVDLLKLSDSEAQKLILEIMTKASEVLPARLKLIGIDIDKEDILPSSVVTPSTTVPETNTNTTNTNINTNTNTNINTNIPSIDSDKLNEAIDNLEKNKDLITQNNPYIDSNTVNEAIDNLEKNKDLLNSINR